MPADAWNNVVIWLDVPPAALRNQIEGLAGNAALAELLERIKAGYSFDAFKRAGLLSDDAQLAVEMIEMEILGTLKRADIWPARDWAEQGVALEDLTKEGRLDAYAATFEGIEDSSQVIFGDIKAAVVERVADMIEGALNRGRADEVIEKAVALLTQHNSEYQWLFDTYNEAAGLCRSTPTP